MTLASTTRPVELEEYRTRAVHLSGDAFADLAATAGTRLGLRGLPGGAVEITATSHVGIIATPEVVVRVRPKVELDNLFHLLGVTTHGWTIDDVAAPYDAPPDDLLASVVNLYLRHVDRLTSQGLLHGYVQEEERLIALRGRLDLQQVARAPWRASPVPCRFDEFIPDIWLNRVLLAALARARRVPDMHSAVRAQLHLVSQRFDGVTPTAIDLRELDRWRPTRLDRHYEDAVVLAQLILRNLTLADRTGGVSTTAFTIDMNRLFEDFVTRSLEARLGDHHEVEAQHGAHLDVSNRLAIRPDIVIHDRSRERTIRLVADTKYKLTEELGNVGDHQQLLAYTTVLGLTEGVLIYCQQPSDQPSPPDEPPATPLHIRGADTTNWVYRVALSGTRDDVEASMDALADWIRHRITAEESP